MGYPFSFLRLLFGYFVTEALSGKGIKQGTVVELSGT